MTNTSPAPTSATFPGVGSINVPASSSATATSPYGLTDGWGAQLINLTGFPTAVMTELAKPVEQGGGGLTTSTLQFTLIERHRWLRSARGHCSVRDRVPRLRGRGLVGYLGSQITAGAAKISAEEARRSSDAAERTAAAAWVDAEPATWAASAAWSEISRTLSTSWVEDAATA